MSSESRSRTHRRPAVYDSTVPSVVSNNYKGAKDATQHLIMQGCKRILCLDVIRLKGRDFEKRNGLLGGAWIVDAQSKNFVRVDRRRNPIGSRNRQRRSLGLLH